MSSFLFGSSKSETTVPQYITDASTNLLDRAQEISRIGYTPYYGPDVAALSPNQTAAMGNNQQLAANFGLGAPQGSGLPQAQTFAGGVQGYSSGDMFEQALEELKARRPGQYEAIMSQFIDPYGPAGGGGGGGQGPAPFDTTGLQPLGGGLVQDRATGEIVDSNGNPVSNYDAGMQWGR